MTASPAARLGLTLADLEDIEAATGLDVLDTLTGEGGRIPLALVAGLAWVILRRDDPALTLDQVRNMDIGTLDLDALAAGVEAARAPKGRPRSRSASASPAPGGSRPTHSGRVTSRR